MDVTDLGCVVEGDAHACGGRPAGCDPDVGVPIRSGLTWVDLSTKIEWGAFTEERYEGATLHRAYDLAWSWAPSPTAGFFASLSWRRPATGVLGPDLALPSLMVGGRWS